MKGEYFVWENSTRVKGAVVQVFTSLKKAKEYIKANAVTVNKGGFSGTLENGGYIGIIL